MYWINKNLTSMAEGNQVAFFADTVDDIQNLPSMSSEGSGQQIDPEANRRVECGSSCFVIATSELYILNSQNIWTKLS